MSPSQFQSLLNKSSLDKLKQAVQSSSNERREDEGYWKNTVDKAGNGSAIIRFLPAPPPETTPFVSYYRHAFQGPNGWYIENSRTTIGEQDPVGDFNSRAWATKDAAKQDQVRKQSRKKTYVSNIYVIKDPGNPENEGKVFLFRYGQKIFDKIKKAIEPEFEGDEAFDPFHVLEGANFRLRQKKQAGYPNYDDSKFETSAPLLGGDVAKLTPVLEQLKSLTELIAPDKFKSYDELKKKFDRVMGFDTGEYLDPNDAPAPARSAKPTPAKRAPVATTEDDDDTPTPTNARPWSPPAMDDDDDDMNSKLSQFDDED